MQDVVCHQKHSFLEITLCLYEMFSKEEKSVKILHAIRVYTIILEWEVVIPILPKRTKGYKSTSSFMKVNSYSLVWPRAQSESSITNSLSILYRYYLHHWPIIGKTELLQVLRAQESVFCFVYFWLHCLACGILVS